MPGGGLAETRKLFADRVLAGLYIDAEGDRPGTAAVPCQQPGDQAQHDDRPPQYRR